MIHAMRRLLSLLLLLSLALGGGVDCCMPKLSAADTAPAGGCHELPQQDPADPVGDAQDQSGAPESSGCGSCTHCVTSAPMTLSARLALMLAPFDGGSLRLAPAGLPAFAPPLRPPIAGASALPIV
jgi:hypothetical protein